MHTFARAFAPIIIFSIIFYYFSLMPYTNSNDGSMKWISQFFFHATLISLCFFSHSNALSFSVSHLKAREGLRFDCLEIVVVFYINDFHFIRLRERDCCEVHNTFGISWCDFIWFGLVFRFVWVNFFCLSER